MPSAFSSQCKEDGLAFEAMAPRRGEVHVRDLRAVLGDDLRELDFVDVLVVAENSAVVTARVELTDVRSGPSTRRAFVCPACREPRHLLLAREGTLRCSSHYRTRRQTERHRADFRRRGGLEEDRLLRLLLSPWRRRTEARLIEARRLAKMVLENDRARVDHLHEQLEALKTIIATAA